MGATHSQSLEVWYASVPGLKVAVPATAYDALGLLRTAFEDNNPIIYAEHALLYGLSGEVPDEWYTIPFGQADVKREGADVTIVAYGRMVHVALKAAQELEDSGIDAEVIDLRTLRPFDIDTLVESVDKTSRCLVVEEAWRTGGFGAEVASSIQERCFDHLDAPVARVGGEDVPMPYASNLERSAIPDEQKIIRVLKEVVGL